MLLRSKFCLLFSFFLFLNGCAGSEKKHQSDDPRSCPIILSGYDITTYFDGGSPKKGNPKYQAVYRGKRYVFLNEENQKAFSKNPVKYAPPLGEHCAFSKFHSNKKIKANPKIFTISDDKIFFFRNNNALDAWKLDEDNYKKRFEKVLSPIEKRVRSFEDQNTKGVLILNF